MQTREHRSAVKRKWYQRNKERILAHYRLHIERRSETTRQWNASHPDNVAAKQHRFCESPQGRESAAHSSFIRRFREHHLTLDQYHALIEKQGDCCAVCNGQPRPNRRGSHDGYHIDHHHVTNRIRGLLCETCNVGLGMLKDSSEVCSAAVAYLSASHS